MDKQLIKKDIGIIVFIIVITFVLVGYSIPFYKFYVSSDDFGYIADTAFFAGYNWKPYTGDMTPYYSPGFSILPAVFFKFFSSFSSIYRGCILYITLLEGFLAVIIYIILRKYFDIKRNDSLIISLALVVGSLAPQAGLYFMSEVPFALCFVGIVGLLMKCASCSGNKQKIYSILIAIVLAYSYAVHTRFLVLVVATILTMVICRVKSKKKLVDYIFFGISFLISLFFTVFWIKKFQNTLFSPTISENINMMIGNDPIQRLTYISIYIKEILQHGTIIRVIKYCLSLLASYTILTGGMIWIVLIYCIGKLKELIFNTVLNKEDIMYLINLSMGLICFFGMNVLIGINGAYNQEGKWLTAYRYARPFVGLIFVMGIILIEKYGFCHKYFAYALLGLIISSSIVLDFIIPTFENSNIISVSEVGWFKFYLYNNQSIHDYFSMMLLFSISLFLFFLILIKKSKLHFMICIFCIWSMVLTYSENKENIKVAEYNYNLVDKTNIVVRNAKLDDDIQILLLQGSYTGKVRAILFDYNVKYIMDAQNLSKYDLEKSIILSDRIDYDMFGNVPKYQIILDDYEFIYTSNEEICEQLKKECKVQYNELR